jgi:hypothetical protein
MPDRNRNRIGGGPEFEVAYYTKELGKSLQREMLQKQLARLSENGNVVAAHGEDLTPEVESPPPEEDRAG